jgi:hypothetical protein
MQFRLGLRLDDQPTVAALPSVLRASPAGAAMVPAYCDMTCYLLPTGNQGQTPSCAGQTAASGAEVRRWRFDDIYEQLDGVRIYQTAKTFDGLPGDGTTLSAAAAAAIQLGYLPPDTKFFSAPKGDRHAAKYAIHRFGGFMSAWNCREDWTTTNRVFVGASGAYLGGNAVWVCGYDQLGIWHQNSWGEGVGFHGLQKILWHDFDRDYMYGLAAYGGWK